MFTVSLWSFAKDSNSTKQPTGTGTQFSCSILTPSDIIAPTVEISANDLTGYNYAYIPAFHRYYFIEGITFDSGLWRLALQCDVLATYKTVIGQQTLFVLRSSSTYDGTIRDNYYPMKGTISSYSDHQDLNSVPGPYDDGYYVLNIAGTGTSGNSTLFQFTPTNFKQLMTELYTAIDGFSANDVVNDLVKCFGGNPLKLINGAMWFPFPFSNTISWNNVYIGNWYPGKLGVGHPVPCERILDPYEDLDFVILDIQKHPQAATRGSYLNLAPFSNYTLFIPGAGAIQLDTTKLIGATSVSIDRRTDAFTGQMRVEVGAGGKTLAVLTGQWGVPLSLAGNAPTNILTGAVSTIGAALSGGTAGIIGAATAGISTIQEAITGTTVSTGSGGSGLNIYQKPVEIQGLFFNVADADNTHNGRPLMQNKQINTLSGFIMVQKGDIPISGTSTEADQIRQLLEGGFYYE